MFTIKKPFESQFRERGSKFIGHVFPADSEEMFGAALDSLKSTYPDATHHCYGWRINPAQPKEYSSDDGEPSGTAGLPILNQLKSFEVINTGIVVVRYYGGTNLGKPGLIEAYGSAAQQCLEKAALISIRPVQLFDIHYAYPEENIINKLKSDYSLHVQEAEYLASIRLKIACPLENAPALEQELSGLEHLNIRFQKLEESYI